MAISRTGLITLTTYIETREEQEMDINANSNLSGTAQMMRYVNQQIAKAHDEDKESTINYKVGNPIQGFTDVKVVVTIEMTNGQKQINVDVDGLK
jgi:negative regulator of sigma E activity